MRKPATRVTSVNLNASSWLPSVKLALLEDRAWELLSAWSGVFCEFMRDAEDPWAGLNLLNFRGEVERDTFLVVTGSGSRLDISIINEGLGSSISTFGFSSFLISSSSVISMISFSFFGFFAASASRSFSKAALVGCKEGHQVYV